MKVCPDFKAPGGGRAASHSGRNDCAAFYQVLATGQHCFLRWRRCSDDVRDTHQARHRVTIGTAFPNVSCMLHLPTDLGTVLEGGP